MKWLITVLSALLIGTAALPAAADPGGYVDGYQLAEADWLMMESRTDAMFYYALAVRDVSPNGAQTIGMIGKGDCDIERGKNWTMISCTGHGQAKELAIDEFQFDPALRSASLEMKHQGVKNVVKWSGRGQLPFYGAAVYGDNGYAGADVLTARLAGAKGRLLGREMPAGRDRHPMSMSFLMQGASAFVSSEYRGRSLDIAPDGSYTYTVETRIPR